MSDTLSQSQLPLKVQQVIQNAPEKLILLCLVLWLSVFSEPVWAQRGTVPDVGVRFSPPQTIMLRQAHVVISADRETPSADVVIKDGKIDQLGQNLPAPAGAEVIDLAGKYVYPAFIDAYVEVPAAEEEWKAGYWNANVLPQRSMRELAQLDAGQMEEMRKTGFGIFLAAPSDGIIKGMSAVLLTHDAPLAESLLLDRAFQHLQLYPARRSREYPNSPMGAVALIRQALADADWYALAHQAARSNPGLPSPDYNLALEELESVIRGSQPVMLDGSNELYALRADRLAREFALKLVIRGSGREYRRLNEIQATHRTFIIPVNFPEAPQLKSRGDYAQTTLQELMHWQLAPENPGRLHAAKVPFVLTATGLEKKSELLSKIRTAIERGWNEAAALHSLTQGPAELLRIEHLAGTLEVGKLANLIVTSGPLFEKSTEIEETWVAGKRHEWAEEPRHDLRGKWSLEFGQADTRDLMLELSGSAAKLKGKIGAPEAFAKSSPKPAAEPSTESDADTGKTSAAEAAKSEAESGSETTIADHDAKDLPTVDVQALSFNGYQLAGFFQCGEIVEGRTGAAILGLAWMEDAESQVLLGSIDWADGTQSTVVARRQPADKDNEESTKDSSGKSTAKDGQESQAQVEADTEKPPAPERLAALDVNYPLGAFGIRTAPEQPEWLLIRGATLWTCAAEGILESADMLVHRGIIHSIGKDIAVPENATVIDGSGMHVSPGIIDCHSHMATDGGVNESGQAVTAEVRIGDFIDCNDITIYRQLAGGVTTSNILHGSANPIGGQNQVIKLRWGSIDEDLKMREAPAGIKFALGENVKQSSNPESTRYPQTRMGVEQIIRDRFEAARWYRQQWQEYRTAPSGLPPRRDYELDALAEVLEKTRWIHCHSYRQDEILAMLRTLDDYGITIGSLQHILEGYKVADAMAKHGATGSSFSDWWAYKFEVYDAIPYNGALMHRAGIIVSFNSDDVELARHLNHEAAKAVKYGGVPPEEALKFVTLNPAKQLRIDSWVGSLEVGKHADFVLWNRSPLSTLSVCTQTWIDGRKYFDREQDLARRQQDAQLHRELVQKIIASGAKTRSEESDDDPSYWWARHDEFCHHSHDEHEQTHQREQAFDAQLDQAESQEQR